MNKAIIILILLSIGLMSCKNSKKELSKLQIAQEYYKILDNSDATEITALLGDSILTLESDYKQTFSQKEYVEWVKWDAVFNPSYEILQIEQEDDIVKAKISKIDKRIQYLHKEPIVTEQLIRFDGAKITSVETTEYVVFNDTVFLKNRRKLLRWIDENHADLNGFINDQTEVGGIKYLKAIQLYKNRNNLKK